MNHHAEISTSSQYSITWPLVEDDDRLPTCSILVQRGANLAQEALASLWEQSNKNTTIASRLTREFPDDASFTAFLLALLTLGGTLHGISMAVRKYAGSEKGA